MVDLDAIAGMVLGSSTQRNSSLNNRSDDFSLDAADVEDSNKTRSNVTKPNAATESIVAVGSNVTASSNAVTESIDDAIKQTSGDESISNNVEISKAEEEILNAEDSLEEIKESNTRADDINSSKKYIDPITEDYMVFVNNIRGEPIWYPERTKTFMNLRNPYSDEFITLQWP